MTEDAPFGLVWQHEVVSDQEWDFILELLADDE